MASLHLRNAYVLAALLLASLPFGMRATAGVALGGAIAVANLRLLERSVARLLGGPLHDGAVGARSLVLRVILHLRLGLLFAIVAVVLGSGRVDPIPFTVGLSSLVPAVLWHGWKSREG